MNFLNFEKRIRGNADVVKIDKSVAEVKIMWVIFGILAIITAICNLICTTMGKESKHFMFISLSFTALTLCALYSADAQWVIHEDWSALSDVAPGMAKSLWICTIVSIAVNSVSLFPLFKDKKEK